MTLAPRLSRRLISRLSTTLALVLAATLTVACSDPGTTIPLDALIPGDLVPDQVIVPDVLNDTTPLTDPPIRDLAMTADVPAPDGPGDGGPDGPVGKNTPSGIYYNQFSGGFSGSEWFELVEQATPGTYSMTDIFGGGFGGTIAADGTITLDQGLGSGAFSGPDDFEIQPNLGGTTFTFACNRAPFTTSAFVLRALPAAAADAALAGTFVSRTSFHDPVTGAEQGGSNENVELTLEQGNLRITDPQGLFFQGGFVAADRVAFRVAEGADGEFGTFPGSATNVGQDLLGEVVFEGPDAWTATFLLQSRAQLGQQEQAVVRFSATRK